MRHLAQTRARMAVAFALATLTACGGSDNAVTQAPSQGSAASPPSAAGAGTGAQGPTPAPAAPVTAARQPAAPGPTTASPANTPPVPAAPDPAAVPGMSSAAPPAMPPAAAQGSSEPMPSPGCQDGSLAAGRTVVSIEAGGNTRTSIQYLPESYDGKTPLPVLLDLHAYSQTGSAAESGSGFRQLADGEKFIYLAPNGIANRWEAIEDDDTVFIRALIGELGEKGCIDLRRIYSTGCSNGGGFTFLLTCTAEDMFAAVAPMCGTSFVDIDTDCMMDRPVSMMLVIGRSDTLNCWEGTTQSLMPGSQPGRTVNVPCAKHVQKVFSEKYNCKGAIEDDGMCETVGECDQGTEVAICGTNTGHVVYSPAVARRAWDFMKRFYKP
jgi:polyhydroxybutyrate depolymerase